MLKILGNSIFFGKSYANYPYTFTQCSSRIPHQERRMFNPILACFDIVMVGDLLLNLPCRIAPRKLKRFTIGSASYPLERERSKPGSSVGVVKFIVTSIYWGMYVFWPLGTDVWGEGGKVFFKRLSALAPFFFTNINCQIKNPSPIFSVELGGITTLKALFLFSGVFE